MKLRFVHFGMCLALVWMVVSALSVSAQTADCVIPPSGPWPACATGGAPASPAASSDSCVIPESGPWPPCATGGGGGAPASTPSSPSADGDCAIPESGPWPPCATGRTSLPDSTDDCVFPSSGAWPSCATGGEAATPESEPEAEPEMGEEAEEEMSEDETADSEEPMDDTGDDDVVEEAAEPDQADDDAVEETVQDEDVEEDTAEPEPATQTFTYNRRLVRDMFVDFMNATITDDPDAPCDLNKCWQADAEMTMGDGVITLASYEIYQEGDFEGSVVDDEEDEDAVGEEDEDGETIATTTTRHEIRFGIPAENGVPVINILNYEYNYQNRTEDAAEIDRVKQTMEAALLGRLQADLSVESVEAVTISEEELTFEYR